MMWALVGGGEEEYFGDPVQPGKQQRREGRADHAIAPGGPKKDLI
jgi:hypothetical protein